MENKHWLLGRALGIAMLAAVPAVAQTSLEQRLLALAPQQVLDDAAELRDGQGRPAKISVKFERGDFEGTGRRDLIAVLYRASLQSRLWVFRETGSQLQIVADLPDSVELIGSQPDLEIVDIEGDGKPEIVVRMYGASVHYGFQVLRFASPRMQSLTEAAGTTDAELIDIEGDGILEIVAPPATRGGTSEDDPVEIRGDYRVFKLQNGVFQHSATSSTDPTGRVDGNFENRSVAIGRAKIRPRRVTLAQIQRGRLGEDRDKFRVRLGNLTSSLPSNPGARSVQDVDLATLILGRNLRPTRTLIVTREGDDDDDEEPRFVGPYLRADFTASEVLAFLPRTQLSKPLAVGDVLTLEVRAKMKDGAPVSGSLQVKIVAREEDD